MKSKTVHLNRIAVIASCGNHIRAAIPRDKKNDSADLLKRTLSDLNKPVVLSAKN